MNNELTYIAVVLDRSGSMSSVKEATEEGLRAFIDAQRKLPGEAVMSLVQFDNLYEINAWEKPLKSVTFEYQPRGGTALLDALGKTIESVGQSLSARPESNRPGKVVFVVVTDGEENSSREFTREKVFDMITHQRTKYSWEFVFLGANQDAIQTGTSLGMAGASAMTYTSNLVGTRNAFATSSASVGSYRSGATKNAVVDDIQRQEYDTNTAAGVVMPTPTPTPGSSGASNP